MHGRDPHITRVRGGDEHRIEVVVDQLREIGRRLGGRRLDGFGAHEIRHRRVAAAPETRERERPARHQCDVNNAPPHPPISSRARENGAITAKSRPLGHGPNCQAAAYGGAKTGSSATGMK